jgi:Chaperone of endosialidase
MPVLSISSGNNFWGNSSTATAVATGSTSALTVGFSAWARQVVGSVVDSSLSGTRSDWNGSTSFIGIQSNITQDAGPNTTSNGMTSFGSRAYINRGKVKNVVGIFLDRTSMVGAPVGEAQLPDTAWGIYQTNMVTGTAGNLAAKNFFQGNVLIKPIDTTYNFAVQYAEASESLAVVGNILATGTVTQNSDITLKKDIVKIDSALNKLSQIKGVTYKWKNPENHGDDETEQLGVIAQDVEKVFPQAVSTDTNGIKSVSYGDMVAPLIEAIKELKAEIEELKKKVA